MNPEDVIKFRKECAEFKANYQKSHSEKYESNNKLNEWVKSRQSQGVVVNPFIAKWLENEIAAARGVLIIGMLLTLLVKGQIVIWAILYAMYRARIKRAKKEALEEDRKRWKK